MITVIEQSTSEREQEIIDLFNEIKPLLDEGHSYASALNTIDPSLARSRACKKIKDYGETQGYSKDSFSRRTQYLNRNRNPGNKNKYGLHKVTLTRKPAYLCGYAWLYTFFEDEILKTISSSDLKELRRKVEEKGLEWKVTDLEKAHNAYELNKIIQENARVNKKSNKSGVYRVSKGHCPRCSQGFTWIYTNRSKGNKIWFSSVDLNILKEIVLESGEDWIIVDEEKAKANGLIIEGE